MPDPVHPNDDINNNDIRDAGDLPDESDQNITDENRHDASSPISPSTPDVSWEEVEAVFADSTPSTTASIESGTFSSPSSPSAPKHPGFTRPTYVASPPLALVETAFLASTASLLWLISYYLSIGSWMRILFPIPIALVHLRWGNRAAWMAAIVSGLLLSVLMGPYLSILFLVPFGILGVQLGFLWKRQVGWGPTIAIGTIVATLSLFFRLWLLSTFLGEDLWVYLTGRITDLLEWLAGILVNWGILGVGMLGQPDIHLVQLATVGMVLFSDFIYLFTVHLTAWLLLERLGSPIPMPPQWVQVILDEPE